MRHNNKIPDSKLEMKGGQGDDSSEIQNTLASQWFELTTKIVVHSSIRVMIENGLLLSIVAKGPNDKLELVLQDLIILLSAELLAKIPARLSRDQPREK